MYRLANNGEIGAPCGVPLPLSLLTVLRCLVPFVVLFFHRHLQPCFYQCQHRPVAHAPGHTLHQFMVRDSVEVTAQVRIDYLLVPSLEKLGALLLLLRARFSLADRHTALPSDPPQRSLPAR